MRAGRCAYTRVQVCVEPEVNLRGSCPVSQGGQKRAPYLLVVTGAGPALS